MWFPKSSKHVDQKMLHRPQEVQDYVIHNMATSCVLDDAVVAHDGPMLGQTCGRFFGTVIRCTDQPISKRRSSRGRHTSANQSHTKRCMQLRRRLLPTLEKRRKKDAAGYSHVTSGISLLYISPSSSSVHIVDMSRPCAHVSASVSSI